MEKFPLELYEIAEKTEQLDDGVLLEHFVAGHSPMETEEFSELYGEPEKEAAFWYRADSPLRDGAYCERYIRASILGESAPVSDSSPCAESPFGFTRDEIGRNLERDGVSVYRELGATADFLREALHNNEKVICCVSDILLERPELARLPIFSANSFVEVTGINGDGSDGFVYLNDPAAESGGTKVRLDTFQNAWSCGGCHAVFVKTE